MTTAEIIACFRLTVPAMPDVTDVELASDIDIYRYYVSEKVFGRLYGKALCYFIAHMRTLNDMIVGAVAAGSNAGDSSITAGAVTSEREGDLQRSYATLSAGTTDESKALLMKTLYGQLFLQLRRMCIIPATVRHGGCYGRY